MKAVLTLLALYVLSAIFVGAWLGLVVWEAARIAGMRL